MTGYRRFLVGLDIAQSIDANAFAIILDERVPQWTKYAQELGPRRRVVVRAERISQMSYVELAKVVRNLMLDKSIARNSYLVVDASGVGRAFCDLLNTRSVQHTRMQIVGDFPMRNELQHELESFEASIGTPGRMRIEGGTKAGHADIAMAAAMALWLSDHRTVGAHVGTSQLKGYW